MQTELALLAPALQAKQAELATARHAKQRADNEEKRAEKLAMYSIGTSRETSAAKKLSTAQKASIEAEKALKALEPATQEATHNTEKRQAELTKQLQELADEKRSIVEEIQQAKEMAAQTHKELGLQKYAEIVKIDNEQHIGPINEMKGQLVKKLKGGIQPRRAGLRRRSPAGLYVNRTPEAESSKGLVNDTEGQAGLRRIAPPDADSELLAARRGGPFDHRGLPEPRFRNNKQASSATLPGLRQQVPDRPQCRVALPDLCLGYCPSLPRPC